MTTLTLTPVARLTVSPKLHGHHHPRAVLARLLGQTTQRGTPETPGCCGCGRDIARWVTRGDSVYDDAHYPGWIATETYCDDCIYPGAVLLLECSPEVTTDLTDMEHDAQVQAKLRELLAAEEATA